MCVRENTLCTEAPVLLYIFWCSYACITYIYRERKMFVVFTFTEDVIIATQNCIYSLLLHIPAYRPTVFFQVWCIYFTPEIFVCVWKGVGRLQKNWWDRVCVSVKAKELLHFLRVYKLPVSKIHFGRRCLKWQVPCGCTLSCKAVQTGHKNVYT